MRAFIARSRREEVPVIPVLLPGCPDSPQLTFFLEAFTWVDLRQGLTEDGLARLVWGITGKKPEEIGIVAAAPSGHPALPHTLKATRARWSWGIGLSLLGVVLTLAAWLWPRSPASPLPPPKPALYSVRVQVLDPQGQPVRGSTVRTSAGNEPHLLPDGWWEIQVPAAKVPADGQVSLWAEHKEWRGNRMNLYLGEEPNPQVEIHLKAPETRLRGQVVDENNRALAGVRVTQQDGAPMEATTDAEGRFELTLSVPQGKRVGLRAEHSGSAPKDTFCYAGSDSCSIVLEKR